MSKYPSSFIPQSPKKPESSSIGRFFAACKNDPRILDIKSNEHLKPRDKIEFEDDGSGTNSTRRAFEVNDLKNKRTYRTKFIEYGNHNALVEAMSAMFYSLTGMCSPDAKLMVYDEYTGRRDDGLPHVLVGSPLVDGYLDLGTFFIRPAVHRFLSDEETKKMVKQCQKEILSINQQEIIGAADKLRRIELMEKIYNALPDYFHTEIEKAFAASKFIGNWDFSNLSLNNIGVQFTLDKDGNVTGLRSVFVDFGNSAMLGFKGKYKSLSLEHARKEAKTQKDKPAYYDPPIAFSEEELSLIRAKVDEISNEEQTNLSDISLLFGDEQLLDEDKKWKMAILTIYKELADNEVAGKTILTTEERSLRESIRRKDMRQILPHESAIEIDPTAKSSTIGLLTFSDLPRSFAFDFLLKPALEAKTHYVDGSGDKPRSTEHNLHQQKDFYRDSELEVAFRLSLIPDEAIEAVAKKWWGLLEEHPTIFAISKDPEQSPTYTEEDIVRIFKERRDFFVNSIPRSVVNEWIAQNRTQAVSAEQDSTLNLQERVGCKINESNSISTRQDKHDLPSYFDTKTSEALSGISEQISTALSSINDALEEEYREELSELIKLTNTTQNEKSVERFKREQQEFLTEIQQESIQRLLDFIREKSPEWVNSLGLSDKPNCSPLSLDKIEQIWRANQGVDSEEIQERTWSRRENEKRNLKVNQKNEFVLNTFTNSLNLLQTPQVLTNTVSHSSATTALPHASQQTHISSPC